MRKQVEDTYRKQFGSRPEAVSRAPGRVEFLGNHTDYNEGVVLSMAVDRFTWVAIGRSRGRTCRVHSLTLNATAEFDGDHIGAPVPGEWINYIKGVVLELQKRGVDVPAFNAAVGSTIPLSAGMSSSAALEMSFALALGRIADIDLPWQEWAKIGQAAENNYVGARTGLLDQFSSLRGRRGHLVFSDFRSLEVRTVPLPPGLALVVADSMVKHQLTDEYNERRRRCEEAVEFLKTRYPNVTALRDVTRKQLEACRNDLDVTTWRRAMHVVGENERVFAGVRALRKKDMKTFGELMYESHESSRVYFENSCPELDVMVEIGRSLPGNIGSRLSGGGFGGITIHLVEEAEAKRYADRLAAAYESRTGKRPTVMVCEAADGAAVLDREARNVEKPGTKRPKKRFIPIENDEEEDITGVERFRRRRHDRNKDF